MANSDCDELTTEKLSDCGELNTEVLVEKYGPMVSSLSYRMIPDSHIAEEAAQEVWYEVIKSLDSFRGESKISTWIYKIAYRVISKYWPNKRLYDENFLKHCFDGPDVRIPEEIDYDGKLWLKEQCDRCLTAVLQCLRPEKKIAYILRDGAELTYEDIAEVLDKKEVTVRKIVSRSRKKIRKFLSDQCTLYNPDGDCNCRIKDEVEDFNIGEEYEKIYSMIDEARFYAASEKVLPEKNYWKKSL
ncbi:MAG: RNA polymerase sigma factor [Bacillota bacterium]